MIAAEVLHSGVNLGPTELNVFGPELAILGTLAAVLLVPLVRGKRNNVVAGITAGVGLFVALLCLLGVNSWGELSWHPGLHGGVGGVFFNSAGGGLLVMDPFAWLFKLSLLFFGLLVVGLWMVATRDGMEEGEGVEFFALFLTALLGLLLMASTTNLLLIWVALELATLPAYALVRFGRGRGGLAQRNATLKWALGGLVWSAVLVYAMSLLYGASGSLELSAVRQALAGPSALAATLGLYGLLLAVVGKVLVGPLQAHGVAVLEGASLDVGALLTIGYTGAGLAMVLRGLVAVVGTGEGTPGLSPPTRMVIEIVVLALAAVLCFWGTIGTLKQKNVKRVLAYSSTAQGGYMLLAIALAAGTGGADGAVEGWLFYFIAYIFMNAGAFVATAALEQRIGSTDFAAYAGLGQRCPILAAALAVMLASLLGVPLTVGFAAKMKLCQVLFASSSGPGWAPYLAYAALAVLAVNTVLGAAGYLRIVRQMYFVRTELPPVFEIVPATVLAGALAALNVLLFIAYGLMELGVRTFAPLWHG